MKNYTITAYGYEAFPFVRSATAENFIEAVQLFRQLSGEGDVDFAFVIDNRTAEIIIDSREEDWG